VATFTDPGGAEALANYSATINWGDNSPTESGAITFDGSKYNVSGSHLYVDNGQYQVKTTISHENSTPQSVNNTAAIDNVAPTVSILTLPNVAVPGQTVTLVGAFTDPGKLDTHDNNSDINGTRIDWGDGSVSFVDVTEPSGSAPGSVTGSHVYTTAGPYTVALWVYDKDGAGKQVVKTINVQPGAVTGSDPCSCGGGGTALFVSGSNSADKIEIKLGSANHPGKYTVNITTAGVQSTKSDDIGTPISRVIAYGFDGNDDISVDTHGRNVPAWLFGGAGDDKLAGNIGDDVLDGDKGNDSLTGNGGRDLLIGGENVDTLNASKGEDILIGGSLVYADYLRALCEIMKVWTSGESTYDRIQDLTTNSIDSLLDHVFSDSATDTLNGGSGSDWFLANYSTENGSDTIFDKLGGFKATVDFKTDI
jgi:hypothetical protein